MYLITIGSTNRVKVQALEEVVALYPSLNPSAITVCNVSSEVSDQPLSLEETIRGAMNRARNSFKECDLSVGIESGLFQVPYTLSGYMDICACVIYDGQKFHIGLSPAFECPPKVTALMVNKGLNMNQAFCELGLTNDQKLGASVGAVSLLTSGRIDRLAYTKPAIIMALTQIEHKKMFDNC